VIFKPFQLNPDTTKEGEDKYEWYKKTRYNDNEETMQKYVAAMSGLGRQVGIDFKFGGTIANTVDAHRVIQHFQEEDGPSTANKIVDSLYEQYFTLERHPSAPETLMAATKAAGIDEAKAKEFIESDDGRRDVETTIRSQKSDGIDSVPYVILEGKRRDLTLEGAKEVEEYVKALDTIVKESY
jgi:predicted DsbA family dithiol-disulfide isomerase